MNIYIDEYFIPFFQFLILGAIKKLMCHINKSHKNIFYYININI